MEEYIVDVIFDGKKEQLKTYSASPLEALDSMISFDEVSAINNITRLTDKNEFKMLQIMSPEVAAGKMFSNMNKNTRDQIKKILEFSLTDEQKYLKDTNFELYKYRFESNFPEFNKNFPTIMKKVVNGDDLKYLEKMLDAMESIEDNKVTKEEAEKVLGEELAQEYLYPLVNKNKK